MRWKDLYGGTILSCLAQATAMKGNVVISKQYVEEFNEWFGESNLENDENVRI